MDDVLSRRTRALLLNARAAMEMAPAVAATDVAASWAAIEHGRKSKCEPLAMWPRTISADGI